MRDARRYKVFDAADRLVLDVYRVTSRFPREEAFGLTAQMRRAAASIPMNLAEGAARSGAREFGQFVNIAIGSCEEIRYQLRLAAALGLPTREETGDSRPGVRECEEDACPSLSGCKL